MLHPLPGKCRAIELGMARGRLGAREAMRWEGYEGKQGCEAKGPASQ
jgi:hypothetical protein